jgi:NAD-dependent deacetylase
MDDVELEDANEWLRGAARVTVLTGAGISTDSGIPDFRGPNGVWTKNPAMEKASTLQHYLADADVRRAAWQNRLHSPAWDARPNAGHLAIVDLERQGKLVAVVTQNIDELHQRAGSSRDAVVELHGTMWRAVCLACETETPMREQLARVSDAVPDPPCEVCGGILKSATISFGQPLDQAVLARAVRAARSCDVFLAIGSSLTVQPAAGLCDLAHECGARLVVVNGEPTRYDELADAVVRGRTEDVLPRLVRGALDPTSIHGA